MKNSVLYIVGAIALLGGGAFLFLKNKKSKDTSKLMEIDMQKASELAQSQVQTDVKAIEKEISVDDLLAITKIKDVLVSDIKKLKSTASAFIDRDALKKRILSNSEKLKSLGYKLDVNYNLVKI